MQKRVCENKHERNMKLQDSREKKSGGQTFRHAARDDHIRFHVANPPHDDERSNDCVKKKK